MWKSRRRICISYVYFLPLSLLFSSQKKVFLEFENQFLFSFFFTFLSPSTFTVQKLIFQKRFSNVFPASNIKPKRELFFAFQYHELDWHPRKNFKTIFFYLLGSSIFFWMSSFFQAGMAAIFLSSSSLALRAMASFLPFSAAFLAIISRFHLGISAPLGSCVGTCKSKKKRNYSFPFK